MRERAFPGAGVLGALAASTLLLAVPAPVLPVSGVRGGSVDAAPRAGAVADADTLQTTVYRVDVEAGTVDVLVGVGLSIDVARIHTVPETAVYVGGSPSDLGGLRPGHRVRVEFWDLDEGYGEDVPGPVARVIHVLPDEIAGEGS